MVITVYAAFGGAGAGVFVVGLLLLLSDLFEKDPPVVKRDGPQPLGSPDAANERGDGDELDQEEEEEEEEEEEMVIEPEVAAAMQILNRGRADKKES